MFDIDPDTIKALADAGGWVVVAVISVALALAFITDRLVSGGTLKRELEDKDEIIADLRSQRIASDARTDKSLEVMGRMEASMGTIVRIVDPPTPRGGRRT